MESLTVRDDVVVAYEDDWFGPPWVEPDVVVLIHGVAESSRAWTQWVPVLARKLRVIRPDLPGFGSSPVPERYEWTPQQYAQDLATFLGLAGIERFHLVAAKYGGTIAMQLAGDYPDRVISLGLFSSPVAAPTINGAERVRATSVRQWADETQRDRLGRQAPDAQVRWWTEELMGVSDPRSVIGCNLALRACDVSDRLAHISAPTLVVTTTDSWLQPVDEVRRYQRLIPRSRLVVRSGDYYHPAAVEPEREARAALRWIERASAI